MKKNSMNLFPCALTGIGYGIPVTLLCMTLIGGWQEPLGEFTVWTVASALIGILSGIAFGSEKLTLPMTLAIHGTGTFAIVVGACWFCGYASSFIRLFTGVLPVFLIVYAAIYGINYFLIKQEEKRINAALNSQN